MEKENSRNTSRNTSIKYLTTNVQIADIYNKTIDSFINSGIVLSECNVKNSLLLNTLYLTVEKMVSEWVKHKNKTNGGGRKENRIRKRKSNKKKTIRKGNFKLKKTIRRIKYRGGNRKWLMEIINRIFFAILMMIFMHSNNVLSIHPEYDTDVIQRVIHAGEIRELFENKHGTCAANTALFLGSINIQTYDKITEQIIKKQRGLTLSETSYYLNSSLETLWGWESIYNRDLIPIPDTQKYLRGSVIPDTQIYLRGSKESEPYRRNKIKKYITLLKEMLMEMKGTMEQIPEQGILTALLYPSGSVMHAVVLWLTSDNNLVIIDPQEFMKVEKKAILYVDDVSRFPENPNYSTATLENYLMTYFEEDRENGETLLLKNMHVRTVENLEQINKENPLVNTVIDKINRLTL